MPPTTQLPVPIDLPCTKCSYNLRTLSPTSLCPECGMPIVENIHRIRQIRDLRYISLPLGALLIAFQPVIALLATKLYDYLETRLPYGPQPMIATHLGELLEGLAVLTGVILIARSVDNAVEPPRKWPRRFAIIVAAAYCLIKFEYIACYYYDRPHEFPADQFLTLDSLASVLETPVKLILILVGRQFMLHFSGRYQLPTLALLTRIALTAMAAIALLRSIQSISVFTFHLGDHTISSYFFAMSNQIPDAIDRGIDFIFATIQIAYWAAVALTVSFLHHKYRREFRVLNFYPL